MNDVYIFHFLVNLVTFSCSFIKPHNLKVMSLLYLVGELVP